MNFGTGLVFRYKIEAKCSIVLADLSSGRQSWINKCEEAKASFRKRTVWGVESQLKQATDCRMGARNHKAAALSANREKIQRRQSLWCSRDLIKKWTLTAGGFQVESLSSHALVFLCDFWKSLSESQSAWYWESVREPMVRALIVPTIILLNGHSNKLP